MPVRKFRNFNQTKWQKVCTDYAYIRILGGWQDESFADGYVDYILESEILESVLEKHQPKRQWLKLLDDNGVQYDIALVHKKGEDVYHYGPSSINYRDVTVSVMLCLNEHAEVLLQMGENKNAGSQLP